MYASEWIESEYKMKDWLNSKVLFTRSAPFRSIVYALIVRHFFFVKWLRQTFFFSVRIFLFVTYLLILAALNSRFSLQTD